MTSPSCESPAEPTERSAGFVLFRTGPSGALEYLLLRHRNGGHWGFPKGRIEPGETELQAALRETREETGIDDLHPVPSLHRDTRYGFFRDGMPVAKTVRYFVARAEASDAVLSREHVDACWVSLREALDLLSFLEPKALLEEIESVIRSQAR
ncbi:MAG: NUDIX domain-containing protein [Candidatus Bipolaricaulota bacterium]|nr:MAG: NUDIX domain-containing protein [Candidatus Bipolaricaulota bacterium]